jgi:hypothetical protein
MRASHPAHPFTRAWETWQAWSTADVWRQARQRATQRGHRQTVEFIDGRPELLEGPDPLAALAANREVVQTLRGWRWQAMRHAREQDHSWAEIATAAGLDDATQARAVYARALQGQQRLAETHPELGHYDPVWAELLDDRGDQQRSAAEREAGGER